MPSSPGQSESSPHHRFDAHELAMVLSHYDLGVLEQIREYPRGSRRAPKVRIKSRKGEFLLKRRAPGRDDPYRVAFAHDLQLHLARHRYPVPELVGTRDGNNSMLQLGGRIYELFHYVRGSGYDRSPHATEVAGRAMGGLHRLLATHRPHFDAPAGSFHHASWIAPRIEVVAEAVRAVEPEVNVKEMQQVCGYLGRAYAAAAEQVMQAGFSAWKGQIIHGDWHPGNLIYREGRIVAVLDFDSARMEPRMSDLANAALQFAMRVNMPQDPEHWPEDLDLARVRSLLRGYHESGSPALTQAELAALPWLIIEALIVESVVPIAATGSFARIRGSSFLQMVERKVRWIESRASTPGAFLEGDRS
jgi:homoserine kinase type II